MIVTTKELFAEAYGKYAIGAYNINNLEQIVGLFRGNLGKSAKNEDPSDATKSAPFIIQISRGARDYTDKRFLEGMIRTADAVFPDAIFAVHLDHGTEEVWSFIVMIYLFSRINERFGLQSILQRFA